MSASDPMFPLAAFNGTRRVPPPVNEPVKGYAPGSPERASLKSRLATMAAERIDIPLVIGGAEVRTGETGKAVMPHAHRQVLADWHRAAPEHVTQAIAAAKSARADWADWAWEDRAAVFLRAAELLATTWRDTANAATMLGQSKTAFQAEIDAACELIDFWRFNPHYAEELYGEQPLSQPQDVEPARLPAAGRVRLRGDAVQLHVHRRQSADVAGADGQHRASGSRRPRAMLSAHYLLKVLEAAGLPPGVINLVAGDAALISEIALSHPDLAGVHFTGSTSVFNNMWQTIGANMSRYRSYPRIVGETGGKDFILAHASAEPQALAVAIVRGGFEYQGQKCSAASRVYVPRSLWPEVRDRVVAMMQDMRMGDIQDFRNFMGAVIDQKALPPRSASTWPTPRRNATIVAGGKARRFGRLLHRADAGRDRRPAATGCCARRSSARCSRRTCTTTPSGARR